MPPRRKSAPAGRIYKSSIPLQQTKLSAPKRRVTYGKQSTRRAKEDSTLTQLGFVHSKERPEQDEEDEDKDEQEASDYEEAAKKRKSKRRKTSGDKPTNSWNTQTITQLDWSFSTTGDLDEGEEEAPAEERSIYDVPSSSPTGNRGASIYKHPALRRGGASPVLGNYEGSPILGDSREASPSVSGSATDVPSREEGLPTLGDSRDTSSIQMPPPRTPRKFMRLEIPSSQSPATPISVQSQKFARALSPLSEWSVNIAIPFNPGRTPHDKDKQLPKLIVEDTYESNNTVSQVGDSVPEPEVRTSPAKSVRFALPEDKEEAEVSLRTSSIKKETTPYPSQASIQSNVKEEILDSDDEDEDDLEEELAPVDLRQDQEDDSSSLSPVPDLEEGDEMGHNIIPVDPRLDEEHHSDNLPEEQAESEEVEVSTESIAEQVQQSPDIPEDPDDEPETYYGEIGKETQFEADRIVSSFADEEPMDVEPTGEESTITGQTQAGETQRLSTQHLNYMEPRTANSDIFISIHPQHVTNIVNRTKNHEFRTWAFSPSVVRVWIYETKPVATLKYMAKISSEKRPGDIDENGLGNAEFNRKPRDGKSRAYEILQLYELADPVSLSEMISKGWMKSAPQRFSWVGPAVADELIANLKPPLFKDEDEPASSSTDTQEVEEQLFSTISQFTQPSLPPHRRIPSQSSIEKTGSMRPPSSVEPLTPRKPITPRKPSTPGLSQAETVDLTQPSLSRLPIQDEEEDEVIWESPARPVPSSTPRLPTLQTASSNSHPGSDSLHPYSMCSSQFLSKSQLLPESLWRIYLVLRGLYMILIRVRRMMSFDWNPNLL